MTAFVAVAVEIVPSIAAALLGAACLAEAERRGGIAPRGGGAFLAGAGFAWLAAAGLLALPPVARLAVSCC